MRIRSRYVLARALGKKSFIKLAIEKAKPKTVKATGPEPGECFDGTCFGLCMCWPLGQSFHAGLDEQLQGALERVLCKPRALVHVDMAEGMKEKGLDKLFPSDVWPPTNAVRVFRSVVIVALVFSCRSVNWQRRYAASRRMA